MTKSGDFIEWRWPRGVTCHSGDGHANVYRTLDPWPGAGIASSDHCIATEHSTLEIPALLRSQSETLQCICVLSAHGLENIAVCLYDHF